MNVSTALCTALSWLLDRLKPPEQPSEQELIEYSRELAATRIPRLLPPAQRPSTYEPPQKTTDPTQQIHRLAETGRIASMIRTQKLPSVKLSKLHFYKPEPEQADKWLLDVEPAAPEPESALDQLSQLTVTKHDLQAVRERHESRGKAS